MQGAARKDLVCGAARVYTAVVPGPKWKSWSRHPGRLKIKRFLFVSGLLQLVLGLDDRSSCKKNFFPWLGVPEVLVFAGYAVCLLFYLVRFYSTVLETEYILLGMALVFFGVSIGLDLFDPPGFEPYLFEDGAKLAESEFCLISPRWGHMNFVVSPASECRGLVAPGCAATLKTNSEGSAHHALLPRAFF